MPQPAWRICHWRGRQTCIGDVSISINPKLAQRIKSSDLVLAIGPRLGEMTMDGYTLLQAPMPRQKLIHVHASAKELDCVYQEDLMIVLDRYSPPRVVRKFLVNLDYGLAINLTHSAY